MRPVRNARAVGSASSLSGAGCYGFGAWLGGGAGAGLAGAAGGVQALAQTAVMTNVLCTSHERDMKRGTLARPH